MSKSLGFISICVLLFTFSLGTKPAEAEWSWSCFWKGASAGHQAIKCKLAGGGKTKIMECTKMAIEIGKFTADCEIRWPSPRKPERCGDIGEPDCEWKCTPYQCAW